MDDLLQLVLSLSLRAEPGIRLLLGDSSGDEIWEITLDRRTGACHATQIGPDPVYPTPPKTGASLANQPLHFDGTPCPNPTLHHIGQCPALSV